MAILAQFDARNMSAAKYDEVIRRLAAAGADNPPGRLYHICYGAPESVQVLDLYDSPASLESFGRTLLPILQELGIDARPEVHPVHSTIAG